MSVLVAPAMCCTLIAVILAALSLASVANSSGGNMYNISDMNMAIEQLSIEWKTDFIYDVYTVEQNENCEKKHKDGKNIFSYNWHGLKPLYTRDGQNTLAKSHSCGRGCTEEHPMVSTGFPAIEANILDGKKICGRKLDQNYANTKQPSSKSGCPQDYRKCPGINTNQMCIKRSSTCPITDIKIIGKNDAQAPGYKYVPFTQGYKIGFSSTVDSMPVTLLKLQENKPCKFYAYNSLASISGKDRFQINEFKPIMRNDTIWEVPGKQGFAPSGLLKKYRPMKFGCKQPKSKEVFSNRFQNVFKNGQQPVIPVSLIEQQNGISAIKKNQMSKVYLDYKIENTLKITSVKFWQAKALIFDTKCNGNKQTSANEAIEKLNQAMVDLKSSNVSFWFIFFAVARLLVIFIMICFCSIQFMVDGNKLGFIPLIIFTILSLILWIQIHAFNSDQQERKKTLQQFIGYSSKCLTKYDLFGEGLSILKLNTDAIDGGVLFEIILQFFFWILMSALYGGIKYMQRNEEKEVRPSKWNDNKQCWEYVDELTENQEMAVTKNQETAVTKNLEMAVAENQEMAEVDGQQIRSDKYSEQQEKQL